jgi:preprotein translocase subunit SecG
MILSLIAFTTTMIKFLFILALLIHPLQNLRAQNSEEDSVYTSQEIIGEDGQELLLTDTILTIHAITIAEDSIRQWKKSKEYNYLKNLDSLLKIPPEKESSPGQFGFPSASWADRIFNQKLLKFILWMLAAFFVLAIAYGFLKNNGIFKRQFTKTVAEEEVPAHADKLDDDFDKLVHQNIKLGDYRMALRYQFLKTLQGLRDSNQIEYAADKTNSQYLRELPAQWQNDFARLVLNYEYVWYGNFKITREQYESIQAEFVAFRKKTAH